MVVKGKGDKNGPQGLRGHLYVLVTSSGISHLLCREFGKSAIVSPLSTTRLNKLLLPLFGAHFLRNPGTPVCWAGEGRIVLRLRVPSHNSPHTSLVLPLTGRKEVAAGILSGSVPTPTALSRHAKREALQFIRSLVDSFYGAMDCSHYTLINTDCDQSKHISWLIFLRTACDRHILHPEGSPQSLLE